MESLKTIRTMHKIINDVGLKESKLIYQIIEDIEKNVYNDEHLSDIAFEVFESLMDLDSLSEEIKQYVEKETQIKRVSGFKYFNPIISTLKEFGGSGKASKVIEKVIEKISREKNEDDSNLIAQIKRAKKHLSEYDYLYSKPKGVWNLTEKEWKRSLFSSESSDKTKDKFDAKFITDIELIERIKKVNTDVRTTEVKTKVFIRDEYVSQFAKRQSKGICQLCEKPAPFKDNKGKPYLETHHIIWLSKGGDDSVKNVVALCPNCHKKMHILNIKTDIKKLQIKAAKSLVA